MRMRTWCAVLVGALALGGTVASRPAAAAGESWLGVYTQAITPELREGMNYNGSGALVRRVISDSPAARAGVQQGDIIVRVGPSTVDSPESLAGIVRALPAGKKVDLLVVRDDQKKSLSATPESRETMGDDDSELPSPPSSMHMRHHEVHDPPPAPDMHDEDGDRDDEGNGDQTFEFHMPDMSGMGSGRGRLGVRIESLNPDLASYFGGRDTRGALVLEVVDGSAADKAGIRAGDVITRVDDKPIASAEDLTEAVRSSEGKTAISLVRHGAKQTVEASLGEMTKVMRIRRPDTYNWRFQGPGGRWGGIREPDGQHQPRIVIDGDEMNPQLREELDKMKDQLRQMNEELKRMGREMPSTPPDHD